MRSRTSERIKFPPTPESRRGPSGHTRQFLHHRVRSILRALAEFADLVEQAPLPPRASSLQTHDRRKKEQAELCEAIVRHANDIAMLFEENFSPHSLFESGDLRDLTRIHLEIVDQLLKPFRQLLSDDVDVDYLIFHQPLSSLGSETPRALRQLNPNGLTKSNRELLRQHPRRTTWRHKITKSTINS